MTAKRPSFNSTTQQKKIPEHSTQNTIKLSTHTAPEQAPIKRIIPKLDIPVHTPQTEKAAITQGKAPSELADIENWPALKLSIEQCTYCNELANARSQVIFGSGNESAELMIISEAPSNDEDIQGQPFVGKSGQLFNNMLLAINIKRENTFITNAIKCRPPNNRAPHKDEAQACQTFLLAQIKLLKPKLILALGRIAAHNLLNVKTPINQLRGQTLQHPQSQIPIIVSYHPAFLLRNPTQKQNSWADLKQVQQYLASH